MDVLATDVSYLAMFEPLESGSVRKYLDVSSGHVTAAVTFCKVNMVLFSVKYMFKNIWFMVRCLYGRFRVVDLVIIKASKHQDSNPSLAYI